MIDMIEDNNRILEDIRTAAMQVQAQPQNNLPRNLEDVSFGDVQKLLAEERKKMS